MSQSSKPTSSFARAAIPWIVLLLTLSAAIFAALDVHRSQTAAEEQRFRREIDSVRSEIGTRLETYIATLRAGAALFNCSEFVTREEFHTFAISLEMQTYYPGIQGIAFTRRVGADGLDQLIQTVRSEGLSDFRVWPDGPRDEYHAIVYIHPMDSRNRAALGFDMYTEATRREAMDRARDTGQPAATGRVMLVQEIEHPKQYGFLIYVPVYAGGMTPATVEQRRQLLEGYVYAPFRAGDLLRGIFPQANRLVDFRLYDGNDISEHLLLHDGVTPRDTEPQFRQVLLLDDVAGRPWLIECVSTPAFEAAHSHRYPMLVILSGAVVGIILFGLTRAETAARNRAEITAAELRASEAALRRSESRFRRLADANLVGVAFATLDGRITAGNDELCRIFGCTQRDIAEGRIRWDCVTPPQSVAADDRAIQEMRERGTCTPYEKSFVRPDGTVIPVLIGVALMEESSNESVALVIDMTQQKRAEQAIDMARRAAEEANRLKDDFLATVSHELRTPLNAILGWTHLLRRDPSPSHADVQSAIEVIERSARSQVQLIDDLLDVSRIVSGNMRLEVVPIDPEPVIDAAVASLQPAMMAKDLQLVREIRRPLPRVLADSTRLQQIIWNLLSNAIKFTPRDGRITIAAEQVDGELRLQVSDTGIGIKPDFLPYVFDRFSQADPASRLGGLGLGLGIVRHLVELHGGVVSAASEGEHCGSTFVVRLPALSPDGLPQA